MMQVSLYIVYMLPSGKKHLLLQGIAKTLEEKGAMAYTIIVAANCF